jgi:hypothetical protein
LPTDGAGYGIWGTPTDVPNPYYWGQFGEGYVEPTGPADGAITLPPIDLPEGVSPTNNNPNVGTNTTNITTGNNNNNNNVTVPYQSGMNPDLLNSYINEAQGDSNYVNSGMDYSGLNSYINEAQGDSNYVNSGMDYGLLSPEVEGDSNYVNSGMDYGLLSPEVEGDSNYSGMIMPLDETGIADTQQFLPSGMDSGLLSPEVEGDSNYVNSGINPDLLNSYINEAEGTPEGLINSGGGGKAIIPWVNTKTGETFTAPHTGFEAIAGSDWTQAAGNKIGATIAPTNQANFETANSIFNPPDEGKGLNRNPFEETQPYSGIYVDPRTVPEINDVQSNTIYPPTMPAGYADGSNMNLVTTTDKEYIPDVPITKQWESSTVEDTDEYFAAKEDPIEFLDDVPIKTTGFSDEEYQEILNNAIFVNLERPKPVPSGMPTPPIARADMDAWESGDEQGQFLYGELQKEALKNMAGTGYLGIQDTPLQGRHPPVYTAPSYSSRIETGPQLGQINAALSGTSPGWGDSRIWENPPEPTAEVVLPNNIDLVHSQLPRLTEQGSADSLNILMEKMAGGLSTDYNSAPGSSSAIDQIVANTLLQQQAVQPVAEHPRITARKNLAAKQAAAQAAQAYNTPVNVPSIFKPQPAPVASVYAAPGGPPNRPTSNPVSRPTYNWTQNFAAGRW